MRNFQQYRSLFHLARPYRDTWFTLLIIFSGLACSDKSSEITQAPATVSVTHQRVFPKLSFNNPTTLLQFKGDNSRWYITEKAGRIYYFDNDDNTDKKHLYLDISQQVDESFEGGLLGMAFDPDFHNNGFVYLSYTTSDFPEKDNSDLIVSRLSRFSVAENNSKIDPESELLLLTLDQPWNNHNGGNIAFGPDGYLYLGFGDGGAWGDQKNHAQNIQTWFGSLLRLNVKPSVIDTKRNPVYGIPADNPFAHSKKCSDSKGCPEIFAWGFRNPWRFSFDSKTRALWVGDVGQGEWEEIDRVELGKNYGWRCYEGNEKYNFDDCSRSTKFVGPIAVYSHIAHEKSRDGKAASITGGYVYRGDSMKDIEGSYFYADFVHGLVSIIKDPYGKNPVNQLLFDTDLMIVSFGEANNGELFFLSYSENAGIFQLIPKL